MILAVLLIFAGAAVIGGATRSLTVRRTVATWIGVVVFAAGLILTTRGGFL